MEDISRRIFLKQAFVLPLVVPALTALVASCRKVVSKEDEIEKSRKIIEFLDEISNDLSTFKTNNPILFKREDLGIDGDYKNLFTIIDNIKIGLDRKEYDNVDRLVTELDNSLKEFQNKIENIKNKK